MHPLVLIPSGSLPHDVTRSLYSSYLFDTLKSHSRLHKHLWLSDEGCSRMALYNGKFWPNHMIGHRCGTSCKPQRAVLHQWLCQLCLSPRSQCAIILLSSLLLFHIYRNPEDLLKHNILAGSSLRTLVFWCLIRCYCCIVFAKKYFPFWRIYQMFIFKKNLFFIWKCKETAEGGKGGV